jgi:hypothetical protein
MLVFLKNSTFLTIPSNQSLVVGRRSVERLRPLQTRERLSTNDERLP